ncbi:hypothetical protein FHL15_001396 [Xylaria flabelliformis]|uniref:DNA mismatch repair protein MSH3 n=1 Tax=Xylaria flabelliformis TaxID=2512241 RepID=A0A553IBR0_9PEZI|nr:hypothetical protein FHL15_001396 [Xylaria flabelliformis]
MSASSRPRQSTSSTSQTSRRQPVCYISSDSSSPSARPLPALRRPSTSVSQYSSSYSTSRSITSSSRPSVQRRQASTASGRKSRAASSIWGSDSHVIICAVTEARGVTPSVGLSFVNITTNEAILSQICDTQFYVKTIHKIQMYEPSTILMVNTALPPNPKSNLVSIIEAELPGTTIEPLDRSQVYRAVVSRVNCGPFLAHSIPAIREHDDDRSVNYPLPGVNPESTRAKIKGLSVRSLKRMFNTNGIKDVKKQYNTTFKPALKEFADVEKLLTSQSSISASEIAIDQVLGVKAFVVAVPQLREALAAARTDLLMRVYEICRPEVTQPVVNIIAETINGDVTAMKAPIDMRNQRTYAVKSGVHGLLDIARQTYKEATEDVYQHVDELSKEHELAIDVKFDNRRKFWLRLEQNEIEDHSHNEAVMLSDNVIQQLLDCIRKYVPDLFRVCEGIALLDMVASFAQSATTRDYVRPEVSDTLALKSARHPICERVNPDQFVPNDVYANEQHRFQIITGCNMSGKSTYIRMIALMQVMAQVGSFVPAQYAVFPIIRQLFVRMSTDDNIEANMSTFSLEMREMAFILRNINDKSLAIIDELGRGTSSRDGLAIALAISEALIQSGSTVWFATHFEELTRILGNRPGVLNLHLETDISRSSEYQARMTMLYKIKSGPVQEKNYGLNLARAMGFPESFIEVAQEVSQKLTESIEEKKDASESRQLLRQRKMILNLSSMLTQLVESDMDDAALGSYLRCLQDDILASITAALQDRHDTTFCGFRFHVHTFYRFLDVFECKHFIGQVKLYSAMRGAFETTGVGWLTIILGWVLTALALLSLILYIWSRGVDRTPPHHLDDILLYLSFLLSLALMSVTTWAVVVEGQGRHQSDESRSQFELVAKSLLINEVLWGVVNTFLRIGAILFLRKVFKATQHLNYITTILLVASAAYAIAVIATSLAICQPISASWDQTVSGRCGNEIQAYLSLEIISAILDLDLWPLIAIVCCCTTASAGTVLHRFRLWAKSRSFSPSNVIWSISTGRSRWWSSTVTRRDQETNFREAISKSEPLRSAHSLELLEEARSADTAISTPTRLQSETQRWTSSGTIDIPNQSIHSTNE